MIIDDVQAGVGRTGSWFSLGAARNRPRRSDGWARHWATGFPSAPVWQERRWPRPSAPVTTARPSVGPRVPGGSRRARRDRRQGLRRPPGALRAIGGRAVCAQRGHRGARAADCCSLPGSTESRVGDREGFGCRISRQCRPPRRIRFAPLLIITADEVELAVGRGSPAPPRRQTADGTGGQIRICVYTTEMTDTASRRRMLHRLLTGRSAASQAELVRLLADAGFPADPGDCLAGSGCLRSGQGRGGDGREVYCPVALPAPAPGPQGGLSPSTPSRSRRAGTLSSSGPAPALPPWWPARRRCSAAGCNRDRGR